jgi:hypothetical protein
VVWSEIGVAHSCRKPQPPHGRYLGRDGGNNALREHCIVLNLRDYSIAGSTPILILIDRIDIGLISDLSGATYVPTVMLITHHEQHETKASLDLVH